ncbi:conserved hypothetical protein [Agrobacterium fabacearum CFBP 5771]|uniref:hypothetical protein n=1 Tax=Agrobacterium tumefaciens TaxID=358 RepID=UPI0004717CE3|nr:hypothetical protein [Agrobacterium tumefaciens]CVI14815.1 conserved hypothetical protein [Agrobacterium fabacearum CFBP 5771]
MAKLNERDGSRSAGKTGEKKRRWLESFVPFRLEMYLSPAWQCCPRPLNRVIERLCIEHMRHGGQNNGELYVAYSQFQEYGVSKKSILRTLELGEKLGFIEVLRDEGVIKGDIRPPNAYRLTFLPAKGKQNPTDEWQTVTKEYAAKLVEEYRAENEIAVKAKRRAAA